MNKIIVIDTCALIHLKHINKFNLLEILNYSVLTTIFVKLEFGMERIECQKFLGTLFSNRKIHLIPLEIEDLIEMANLPVSKQASDAELSCFVISKRFQGKTMTDDERAIKYATNHIKMDLCQIIRMIDLLFEAYNICIIGDSDLQSIQQTLEANKYKLCYNLVAEAARRRLLVNS